MDVSRNKRQFQKDYNGYINVIMDDAKRKYIEITSLKTGEIFSFVPYQLV